MTDCQNIRYKSDHWWWRLLGTKRATALYPFFYVPSRQYVLSQKELRHGLAVLEMQKSYGLLAFLLRYIMPVPLALFAVLAVINPWGLLFLCAALPIWPAKFRLDCQVSAWVTASDSFVHLDQVENDNHSIFSELKSWRYWGIMSWYPSQFVLRLIRQEKKRQHK